MTHEYQVSGITCEGCIAKVKGLLEKTAGVTAASVGLDGLVKITMSRHVATADLQAALRDFPKYQLIEKSVAMPAAAPFSDERRINEVFSRRTNPFCWSSATSSARL